jgi:hypothetical protein
VDWLRFKAKTPLAHVASSIPSCSERLVLGSLEAVTAISEFSNSICGGHSLTKISRRNPAKRLGRKTASYHLPLGDDKNKFTIFRDDFAANRFVHHCGNHRLDGMFAVARAVLFEESLPKAHQRT